MVEYQSNLVKYRGAPLANKVNRMVKTQSKQSLGMTVTGQANKTDLKHLIDVFRLSNEAEGKSPKTVSWYDEMLKVFTRYLSANHLSHDLSAFNVDTMRGYILYLKDKPKFLSHPYTPAREERLSPKTVQGHVRTLKAFASWLHTECYTTENRLQSLKLPKAPVTVMEPLTPEEINRIIANINRKSSSGVRNHALFVTLLDTGLRASEAAGITLGNLNLADGFIKVMGKGAKERVVPIGKHVRMILFSYIDKVRPEPAASDCDNLFLACPQ